TERSGLGFYKSNTCGKCGEAKSIVIVKFMTEIILVSGHNHVSAPARFFIDVQDDNSYFFVDTFNKKNRVVILNKAKSQRTAKRISQIRTTDQSFTLHLRNTLHSPLNEMFPKTQML
ncbi:MAG: hypothetical protein ABI876_13715, partial [Bacteroidota bacterium]